MPRADNSGVAKMNPGALVAGLSGRLGNAVVVRYGDGRVVVRQRVTPRDPQTPAQSAARARMATAARLFRELDEAEARAWEAYARQEAAAARLRGETADPRAQSAFVRLATKVLQVDPAAAVPRTPPPAPFPGDRVAVAATAAPGAVLFTADVANAPGVVTELLLQPLKTSRSRLRSRDYRPRAFVAFAPGALETTVPAPPGWQAPALRFVLPATGQTTPLAPLPPVRVA